MTAVAEPLHFECAACQARSDLELDRESATLVLLLSMLRDDISAEDYYQGLCFEHRRRLDVALGDWPHPKRA